VTPCLPPALPEEGGPPVDRVDAVGADKPTRFSRN
jgi:hypothetical protein